MSGALPAKDRTMQRVLVCFVLVALTLVGVAVQAVRNLDRAQVSADWVNHTHAVILQLEALRSALVAAEARMHTYLFTGDSRDRAMSGHALVSVTEHLEIIKALTRAEPRQHAQTLALEAVAAEHAVLVQTIVDARQSGRMPAVRARLEADATGRLIGDFQRRIEKLKNEELTLLTERDHASYVQAQATRWTVWLGVCLDVVLLGGMGWLVRDDIGARRRAAAALENVNQNLEANVRARTEELAVANDELVTENLERQWLNQALAHQAHYDQLIIDSISNLVLVLTKAINISRVNPAVTQATGLRTPDLINMPLSSILELLPERTETAIANARRFAYALQSGRELHGVGLLRNGYGGKVPVRVSVCPLRDGNKVVGGVVILEIVQPPASPPSSQVGTA